MRTQTTYDTIGTFAAPATLTAAFSGNQGGHLLAAHFRHLHIGGKFTPGTNNEVVYLLVEVSQDPIYGSAPTNWEQLTVQVAATTEVDVFNDGGTGMSTASGIPLVFPGDKTSTSGTAVPINYDMDINANWVRVAAKSSLGAGFGTANVCVSLLEE